MLCPDCGKPGRVRYTEHIHGDIRRKRECSNGHWFHTWEFIQSLYVRRKYPEHPKRGKIRD